MVENGVDYWAIPNKSVFESRTRMEFLVDLRAGNLKHIILVQIVRLRLLELEYVLS